MPSAPSNPPYKHRPPHPITILPPDPTLRHPLSAPPLSSGKPPPSAFTAASNAPLTTPGIDASQVALTDAPLGRGSFGSVWRGTFAGSPVAIKVCLLSPSRETKDSRAAIQHFRRETARYYHLRHPCIVQFFCVVHDDAHRLLLVTELMKGGSLFNAIHTLRRSGAASLPTISMLRTATHIANGLAYLHASHFSFGDLKSMNVLLSEPPVLARHTLTHTTQAKLCDFGLSRNLNRLLPSETHVPARNGPAGTFAYLAPEAFSGLPVDNAEAPKAADVYALAIVLWELATLRVPWANKQPLQLVKLVAKEGKRPEWPRRHRLPPGFVRLVESCWQRDAALRPSAQQVAAGLATMLNAFLESDNDAEEDARVGSCGAMSGSSSLFGQRRMSSLMGSKHALALALDADLLKDLKGKDAASDESDTDDDDGYRAAERKGGSDLGLSLEGFVSPNDEDDLDGFADSFIQVVEEEDEVVDFGVGYMQAQEAHRNVASIRAAQEHAAVEEQNTVDGFILPPISEMYGDEDDETEDVQPDVNLSSARSPLCKLGRRMFEIDKSLGCNPPRTETPPPVVWNTSCHNTTDTAAVMSDVTHQTHQTHVTSSMESSVPGSTSSSAARLRKYIVPMGMSGGFEEEIKELERENEVGFNKFCIFPASRPPVS